MVQARGLYHRKAGTRYHRKAGTSATGYTTGMWRWVEMLAMFVVGPAVYALGVGGPGWLFPALWVWAGVCLLLLLTDRTFERGRLWNARAVGRHLGWMVGQFVVLAALLEVVVWLLVPERLFGLVQRNPRLWAAIMVFYPVFSVYPQEVVFRTFFFHRYRALFPGRWTMIVASAAAFGYVHVVFQNWIAVALTVIGGGLFAWTYDRTRSTLGACVEHALFGCFVFTVGLGEYFYSGRVR